MTSKKSFKQIHSVEKRLSESSRIRSKYPERVPVIIEKDFNSDIIDLDKNKYLVPDELTIGQLVYVIRKRIKLPPEKAIFIFIDRTTLAPTSALLSNVYEEHKNEDGFLYVTYSGQDSFGNNFPLIRI